MKNKGNVCFTPLAPRSIFFLVFGGVLGHETIHIGKRIAPFTCHNQDGVLVQLGTNEGIHLSHVAAKPEQPAGGRGQNQDALHNSSVGSLRGDDRQNDANHAENRRENDDR